MMDIVSVTGSDIVPLIPDLARLRIEVFREWPYLYDGDMAYEERYLRKYADTEGAAVVIARVDGSIIGASTSLPLTAAEPPLQEAFHRNGENPAEWYYFGESVLEHTFRGRGIGVAFFQEREAQARRLGYVKTAFCAVERPEEHPLRPTGYVPLHAFWRKRGYERRPELEASFRWKDIGETEETSKPMVFWVKEA